MSHIKVVSNLLRKNRLKTVFVVCMSTAVSAHSLAVVYTFCFLCLSVVYDLKSRNWVEGDGWHFAGLAKAAACWVTLVNISGFLFSISTPQQWMNRQKKVKGTLKTLSQMQMCGLLWHPKYLFGKLAAKEGRKGGKSKIFTAHEQ